MGIPLEVIEMAHYVLSVVAVGEGHPRFGLGAEVDGLVFCVGLCK